MSDSSDSQEPEKRSNTFEGNVWKFYLCKGLFGLSFGLFLLVVVLYYLDRGITLAGFMVLMTVLNFTQFAFEVPAGIVADRLSRKWSVCSGLVAWSISWIIVLTTTSYSLLIVSFFGVGLGGALSSGADSALLYDTLKVDGKEEKFQQTMGNGISWQLS